MRGPSASRLLERALAASATAEGAGMTIETSAASRWESATFSGSRHVLELRADAGSAVDRWLASLPERDFVLPGHVLADMTVADMRREGERAYVRIEALTVVSA